MANPKQNVVNVLKNAFRDQPVEVRGTRIRGRFGGEFLAEADVEDRVIARVRHRDWRKAYNLLANEVQLMWLEGRV
ncbi:MAG: hypothetical protein EBT03_09870 [Betaproteobacteria bacterium]|nr:hypothetical protein [Betaproteobacteria bacterium]NCA17426.1 hypothetical protein [Betaproteobacteria bacterium]